MNALHEEKQTESGQDKLNTKEQQKGEKCECENCELTIHFLSVCVCLWEHSSAPQIDIVPF